MKKYEDILFISDLDGTLITTNKAISKKNKEAIRDFISQGGEFTIATGRTVQNVLPYLDGLSINKACILYNGGAIYDLGKKAFIACSFLNKDKIVDVIKWILEQYSTLCIQVFTTETIYIVNHDKRVDPVVLAEKQAFKLSDIESILHKEWMKIILNGIHEELVECDTYLKSTLEEGVIHTVFSVPTYLEILPFGVSKGTALKELIKLTGAQNKKVIAIGDYDNDIEMIKMATVGIATRNASEGAKNSADLLTVSNDEDAIFEVITHILPSV
ncbi:HAD family hydrolase [Cellulosilyticum sp. I15G10I2]|uniref:HAD family hydrolase n=1 Tax=Cellulosilyticum sp. I15G10I2 TaxID=1892843 RepID=UPI00085BF41A|nr:HAD family hydrolase [Cellulosilyticum sp. I15G10I2]